LKFGTRGLHLIPLSHYAFRENQCSENHTLLATVNEILPNFYFFSSNLGKIRFRKRAQKRDVHFNLKIHEVKTIVYFGAQTKFNSFFPQCCPIWVKFGVTDLLLIICELHAVRHSKAALLYGHK